MGEEGSGGGGDEGTSLSSAVSPGGREEGRGGGGASSSDSTSPFIVTVFSLVRERGGVSGDGTVTMTSLRATGLSGLDESRARRVCSTPRGEI